MNENGRKRKEWIKTIAIVFLTILLILTFFSNTIMNYSLPEVAAQYVQSGNITAKIRGYGTIESGDPYNVKLKGIRKVESVEVRQGDKVEKGQVLCFLSAEDSTELETAKEALQMAEEAFDLALLTGEVDSDVMNNAGNTDSTQNYKAKIIRLRNEIEAVEKEVATASENVKDLTRKRDDISLQIALANTNTVDTSAEVSALNEAKNAMDDAKLVLDDKKNNLQTITSQIELQESVSSGDAVSIEDLIEQKIAASQEVIDAETAYNAAVLAHEKAQLALAQKEGTNDKAEIITNYERQAALLDVDLAKAGRNLEEKKEDLETKEKELGDLVKNISDEINLGSKYDDILKAREEVSKLEALVEGSTVVAPISGTILGVNVKSGLETPEDGIVFTMQPEGEGYTMSFSVTTEQAQKLSVGDIAEPVNSWRYDDMLIILDSIRPDPADPGQKRLLLFNVSGESVIPNQSMNVSVGQKTATYDMIVPNSAIREDNNGKFVLIVESKSSPIGTRYTASRVDVEVLASDDTQSAVSGALNGWEFVITTSTKPIEAGQQVRLPE